MQRDVQYGVFCSENQKFNIDPMTSDLRLVGQKEFVDPRLSLPYHKFFEDARRVPPNVKSL